MSEVKLEQIMLANAVKLGRNHDLLHRAENDYRGHGTEINLIALKIPVENDPGKFVTQTLVKLVDKATGETTYTSLMNATYFKMNEPQPIIKKRANKVTI